MNGGGQTTDDRRRMTNIEQEITNDEVEIAAHRFAMLAMTIRNRFLSCARNDKRLRWE